MIPQCLAKHVPLHPWSHAINPNMYQVCICHAKLTMTEKECANNICSLNKHKKNSFA